MMNGASRIPELPVFLLPHELQGYPIRNAENVNGSREELVARCEGKLRELAVKMSQTRETFPTQSQNLSEGTATVGNPTDVHKSPRSAISDGAPQQDSPFKRVFVSLLHFSLY